MSATHDSAREYEREAEATRHRLADTLNELHDRLTPGDILNEVLSYGRSGGGAFFRAATTAARQNPIPAILIGTGCAMFMAEKTGLTQRLAPRPDSGRDFRHSAAAMGEHHGPGGSMGSAMAETAETVKGQASSMAEGARNRAAAVGSAVSDTAAAAANRVSDAAGSVSDRVSGAAAAASDAAASAAQQARQGARQAGDAVTGAADQLAQGAREARERVSGVASELAQGARDVGAAAQEFSTAMGEQITDTAERARQQAANAARQAKAKAQSLIEEQPLLVGAIALAFGAALAALLPPTKTEDELMGETSDSVKETVAEAAGEQYQKAKEVAGSVASRAKEVAAEEGLTAGSAADIVRNVGDKVKRVVTETTETAQSELREKAGGEKPTG
jgi:hypothetical protein